MEMFCRHGEAIVSIFDGGKVVCARLVSSTLEFINFKSIEAFSILLI
jgi:hypothetical protein